MMRGRSGDVAESRSKVGRGELTDAAWARIAGLSPPNGLRCEQWRAGDTHYEKRAEAYRAAVALAALVLWPDSPAAL